MLVIHRTFNACSIVYPGLRIHMDNVSLVCDSDQSLYWSLVIIRLLDQPFQSYEWYHHRFYCMILTTEQRKNISRSETQPGLTLFLTFDCSNINGVFRIGKNLYIIIIEQFGPWKKTRPWRRCHSPNASYYVQEFVVCEIFVQKSSCILTDA